MTKTFNFQRLSFGHFVIQYSDLFGILDFDIRPAVARLPWNRLFRLQARSGPGILLEYDFSFRDEVSICRGKCKLLYDF